MDSFSWHGVRILAFLGLKIGLKTAFFGTTWKITLPIKQMCILETKRTRALLRCFPVEATAQCLDQKQTLLECKFDFQGNRLVLTQILDWIIKEE